MIFRISTLVPALTAAAMGAGCCNLGPAQQQKGVGTVLLYDNDMVVPFNKIYGSMGDCLADGTNIFERVARARYDADIKALHENAKGKSGNYMLPRVIQVCVDGETQETKYNGGVVPERRTELMLGLTR